MNRIQQDFNLEKQLEKFEHQHLKGRKGIETLYEIVVNNYLEPDLVYRTEKRFLEDVMNHCTNNYKTIFDLYFYIYPEKAKEIVDEHQQKFIGWKKTLVEQFIRYCSWSYCKSDRYKSARNRLESELEKLN